MATDWHPEIIKAELRRRYGTLGRLATAWGYTRASLSRAIHHAGCSAPVELKIARALDKHPHEIWPSRWTKDGLPVSLVAGQRRGGVHGDRPRRTKQRENGAVA